VIELRDVTVDYPDRPVLRGVDLTVGDGELVLVAGRTGVGKSTLLGTFNGLVPAFTGGRLTGDVLVDGTSVLHLPPRDRVETVGYVGQDPAAGFVTDVVEDELAYGMEQLGLPAATMRRRVEETLDLLGIAGLRRRNLRTLSGGEQQRVAIGSVLTMHPRVLVLDEPTSALDPTAAEDVLATLTRLVHDVGLSVVLAEHRLERVMPYADQLVLLTGDGGARAGDPATLLRDAPVAPPLVELGRRAGWDPLPLTVRDARRRAGDLVARLPEAPAGADERTGPDLLVA
jgi:energy-coupling factor transport system ATP-binding protein